LEKISSSIVQHLLSRNLYIDTESLAIRTLVDKEESLNYAFTSRIYSPNSSHNHSLGPNVKNHIAGS